MSNSTSEMIVRKVRRSLEKLGFGDCSIREFQDGRLSLHCPSATRDDQTLIQVAMRLIAGVTSVVFESTTSG